ncbi:MAG: hypothetical protein ACK559_01065 [bacterium]
MSPSQTSAAGLPEAPGVKAALGLQLGGWVPIVSTSSSAACPPSR